jgi:hypothetical protein
MAVKKFSITHYINTKVKAREGEKYPIYVRATYNRQTNNMVSYFLKDVFISEPDFDSIMDNSFDKTNKELRIISKKIQNEISLFTQINEYFEKYGHDFSVYKLHSYITILDTSVNKLIDSQLTHLIKLELCEIFHKKTNIKYSLIEKIISDNIANEKNNIMTEILINYNNLSQELFICSFCDIMLTQLKELYALAEINIISWFFLGGKNAIMVNYENSKQKKINDVNVALAHWSLRHGMEHNKSFYSPKNSDEIFKRAIEYIDETIDKNLKMRLFVTNFF